jgi:hypothetical protein
MVVRCKVCTVVGLAAGDDSSNHAYGFRSVRFVGLLLQDKFRLFDLEAQIESLERGAKIIIMTVTM